MGIMHTIKDTMSKAAFSPAALMSGRGGLHMAQIILSLVAFLLSAFRGGSTFTYWNYAMFTWAFCPIMTLIITLIEMFKLDLLLVLCLDWSDFTTGMAMSSSLMTVSSAIIYGNFYACRKCLYGWIMTICAFLVAIVYVLEVVNDKFINKKKSSYLAALPGFWKVMEAFVSCMIFVSLTGYSDKPALIMCVIAYAIPFPLLPVIIATNILKKLKACLPFNLDRYVFIFLVVSVLLYVFAAIMWPIFMFKNNPRPSDCPPSFCIWAIQFMVAFLTYVNLILFTLDMIFTLLNICDFKRN